MPPQFHQLTVSDVVADTSHAVRISFDVPEALHQEFRYRQGQYLTLESDVDGKTVRRSYSICSGVNENLLQIAIKRVEVASIPISPTIPSSRETACG